VDEFILAPHALGRSVTRDFLANSSFQHSEDNDPSKNNDKVSISSIHRSKGLEWSDVYVPYFNQGFLPTGFYAGEEKEKDYEGGDEEEKYERRRAERHLPDCSGLRGGR
jgi:superfamily I DNA/RNA helicase